MKQFDVKKIIVNESTFYFEISNQTNEDIFLKDYVVYEQDSLLKMGLNPEDCTMFRSGRHKNDVPSVFKFGKITPSMQDAMGGMTETGDKSCTDLNERCILSDHLTILGSAENYFVITFPNGRNQLVETAVYVDDGGNFVRLQSRVIFNIVLKPGQMAATEWICIENTRDFMDAINTFVKKKVERYGTRNQAHPSVFCTWYYYGLTVTYEDVMTNLNKMKERKLPFDVFQIDEGWEITLGEWEPNKKFPIPMKKIAEQIMDAGYRPGIWTSPFVAHETATIWKKHPEWALKDADGNPCLFPMNDTVYWVFDITNKATWDYFRELYHRLTFEWGYTYHKLDFTRAAVIMENAVYYDNTITLVEAYYGAVRAIREGMGEESYFLMCGGLYDPIIGLVDAQRTGSDVLSMWSSNINKDGKTQPYTVKQSILRYYMNAWWNNDPDALMVRRNEQMERNLRLTYGLLNEEEVKTTTINQYMGGGIVCSTEPLDKIDDDRLGNLRRIMPVVATKISPIDLMNGEKRYPENMKIEVANRNISSIVRINWSDTEDMKLQFALEESMLPQGCTASDKYIVCDYYGKMYETEVSVGETITLGTLLPHSATVIKIQKQENIPVIVESTGHFSMGGEDIYMAMEADKLVVRYKNLFDWPIEYKILLPMGYYTEKGDWTVSFTVNPLEEVVKEWSCVNAD